MLRFVYVILIWVVLFGGLQLFLQTRSQGRVVSIPDVEVASGQYRLEITTTFAVEPDPFALAVDVNDLAPALLVQLEGRPLVTITDRLEAGKPVIVQPLTGVKVGRNEFLVKAHPPSAQAQRANALRLSLFRDEKLLAERSVWSTPPEPLVATITVEVEPEVEEDADYDH